MVIGNKPTSINRSRLVLQKKENAIVDFKFFVILLRTHSLSEKAFGLLWHTKFNYK